MYPIKSSWSLTKEQRQYNEAKIVFSTNGVETTVCPHAKKKKKKTRQTLHPSEKLTKNQ